MSHKRIQCPKCGLEIAARKINYDSHVRVCDGRPMFAEARRRDKLGLPNTGPQRKR